MKHLLLLLIIIVHGISIAAAQKVVRDSLAAIEGQDRNYRIQLDTTTEPHSTTSSLLYGKEHVRKSRFLNQLQPLEKSAEMYLSGKWTLDSIVVREWNEDMEIVEQARRQSLFSQDDGQTMNIKDYNWNTDEAHWQISESNYYFFGQRGELDSVEFQEYVTTNYRMFTKIYYSYKDGNLVSEWRKEKFDEYDDWEKLERLEYEYDSLLRLTRVDTREWDVFYDRWSTFEFVAYTYDSLGNLSTETGFDYDDYENTSTQKYQLKYFYNNQNLPVEVVEYVEGWQTGIFVPERKLVYDYDINLELRSEIIYNWDYDRNDWLEERQKIYENEATGDLIHEVVVQEWEEQWMNKDRALYYANDGILPGELENIEFIASFLPVYVFNDLVVDKVERARFANGTWQESGGTTYHFKQNRPVGIDPAHQLAVGVYPNPTDNYLQIEVPDEQQILCNIYDLSGRILIRKQFRGKLMLDVSEFNSGYYLIELRRTGKQVYKGRFIKR